ncbi:hypothetical protein F8B91_01375 [Aestuariivirga litoralis]|nr:hypothetical protein [Aestuariivirga litoralis]
MLTRFFQLFDDPLVYVIKSGWSMEAGFGLCRARAKGKPFHVLIPPAWDVAQVADELQHFVLAAAGPCPEATFHFLCPGEADVALLKARGLNAFCAHQNAFLDETIFKPDPAAKKQFRAVHNAALTKWKRHELAWGVKNIAVITFLHEKKDNFEPFSGYKSLAWSNATPDGKLTVVPPREVARINNASGAGISLSRTEGCCYANGEYQFCGLPVVSTKSTGGRSDFYDSATTKIVWDHTFFVERAVRHWERHPPDPTAIHGRTIEKAIRHRVRVLDWLKEISGINVHAQANANAWHPRFHSRFRMNTKVDPAELPPPVLNPYRFVFMEA